MSETIKSNHALILNRLHQMQQAPYYATAKEELALAQQVILDLEADNRRLTEDVVTQTRKVTELIEQNKHDAGADAICRHLLSEELDQALAKITQFKAVLLADPFKYVDITYVHPERSVLLVWNDQMKELLK